MATLPNPADLDWGAMSKAEFKRNELAYELAHEDNVTVSKPKNTYKPAPKEFPVQEVLAAAFAAYRINGNQYLRDTRRFTEEENATVFANKELVKFHFAGNAHWVPNDFKGLNILDEDYDAVKDAMDHFKSYTFKLLANDLSNFQKNAFNAVQGETVHRNNLGIAAYVPELISRELKENAFKKLLRTEYHNSEHIGKEKDVLEGNIKILQRTYSSKWESNNYIADYMGNIVSFMKADVFEEGRRYEVKAKVKSHGRIRLFDVNETRLNYVKVK
jgi:hypothetical protein